MLEPTVQELVDFIRSTTIESFGRSNGVVGVSGGIDSAVTLALTARALGAENTHAILMPERENSAESTSLGIVMADQLGVRYTIDDMTDVLTAAGCYDRRTAAIRTLFPEYDPDAESISVHLYQDIKGSRLPARYTFRISKPDGSFIQAHPSRETYTKLFAASNYKQRLRTVNLYYRAEIDDACVVGTSNYDEEYLGFFVKVGDGTWDLCPLEGLTKTFIRRLARELQIPEEITSRPTTTDTFPIDEQSQEDMFYALPFEELDILLSGMHDNVGEDAIANRLGWTPTQVRNAVRNLRRRHQSTRWNRLAGLRYSSVVSDARP